MSVAGDGDQGKPAAKKPAAKKAASRKPEAGASAADDAAAKADPKPAPPTVSGPTPPTLSAVPTPPKVAAREPRRQPYRSEPKLPVNPRRVRGGVKLSAKEGEQLGNWISQRFFRIIEAEADGEAVREGLNYARLGQTKTLEITDEGVDALVQGRRTRPYPVTIRLETFNAEQRGRVIETMVEQSRYAAKLLAGELPSDIEDLFAPLGLRLFPAELSQMQTSCKCGEGPWCKHAVCAAALVAERMAQDPFILFQIRGLASEEMLESIRERRAIAAQGERAVPVHRAHVPGASDYSAPPLEDVVDRFWDGERLDVNSVDLSIVPPEVAHALLRRLGPSPFEGSRFRFVGLMATCYEVIGEKALDSARSAGDGGEDEEGGETASE